MPGRFRLQSSGLQRDGTRLLRQTSAEQCLRELDFVQGFFGMLGATCGTPLILL